MVIDKIEITPQSVEILFLDLIERIIQFSSSKVCKHYVAGMILEEMEKCDFNVTNEVCRAVISAYDDEAIEILQELKKLVKEKTKNNGEREAK